MQEVNPNKEAIVENFRKWDIDFKLINGAIILPSETVKTTLFITIRFPRLQSFDIHSKQPETEIYN